MLDGLVIVIQKDLFTSLAYNKILKVRKLQVFAEIMLSLDKLFTMFFEWPKTVGK